MRKDYKKRRVLHRGMASDKDGGMNERLAHIKQEDCEWGAGDEACVRSEACEGGISVFKEEECKEEIVEVKVEDLENVSVSPGYIFKQGICEASHSSFQSQFTNTGQLAAQQNSMEVKSEFEGKITEGIEREAEDQSSSRSVGRNLQGSCSFSTSSLAQMSVQYRLLHKENNEKMKKSSRGPDGLAATFLLCSALPAAELTKTGGIAADPYCVHNTDQDGENFLKAKLDFKDKSVSSVQPYICSECGKVFPHKNSLYAHKRIHIGEKPHCCAECGKRFLSNSALQQHTRVHTGEKPYSCSECGKRFSHQRSLKNHTKIHTGDKPYCCSDCGKEFSFLGNFQNHLRIHTGEKPYCCSECGKTFTQGSSLRRHIRIHTGEKPHCCSECGKRFSQISTLQRHRQTHTGEKPYSCLECGKQFSKSSHLQRHMQIHTGEKPYCCSECGKQLSDHSSLRQHTRIHTGEKPFCCSECGKRFSNYGSFQQHRRVHTGEKPYCCSECGKRFSQRSGLRYHSEIHTGEKRIRAELAGGKS
ncbi:gastrula zinc finger protein XlCGF26.1-like isoform X1 [Polypterus senegalus]|uniref:gastrula zinc finger protein XlCGF26.1-like isoform X1 n=1 Tax=Polypterus senegalus TaxID=55291 RepID=UPI0019629E01|nr:gastrula zinc finger protein XlCGF26.1-like isoform X1 [Polypterus senegalus]